MSCVVYTKVMVVLEKIKINGRGVLGLGNSEETQARAKMELFVDRKSVIIFIVIIGGKGKRCLCIVNSFIQWHITEFS